MQTIQHSFLRSDGTYMVIRTTVGEGLLAKVELVEQAKEAVSMEPEEML